MTIRALIIGIQDYDAPEFPDLHGSLADATGWLALATERLGAQPSDLRVLTCPPITSMSQLPFPIGAGTFANLVSNGCFGRADQASILEGFEWLIRGIEQGKRGLLVYSGYGTQLTAGKVHGVRDARVRAIVPCDAFLELQEVPVEASPVELSTRERARRASLATVAFRRVLRRAIPLPDRTLSGIELPAGNALDRARDPKRDPWSQLTVVLDTSFTVPEEAPRQATRSLPIVGTQGSCLPYYELSSRTLCACPPGQDAIEVRDLHGMVGGFSRALLAPLNEWPLATDNGEIHVQIDHRRLAEVVSVTHRGLDGRTLHPTLMGAEHVGPVAFLHRNLARCTSHDGFLYPPPVSGPRQIDAGHNGFRAYELTFDIRDASGAISTHVLGQLLCTATATPGRLVDPGDPDAYPRYYPDLTELWRTDDAQVLTFFDAAARGVLVELRLQLRYETLDWDYPSAPHVTYVRNVFERPRRKRHCSMHPSWILQSGALSAASSSGGRTVRVQTLVGGVPMVVSFHRSLQLPEVIASVEWHHARASQGGTPTFFGGLQVQGQPKVFRPAMSGVALPAGANGWWTAASPMSWVAGDP